MWESLVQVREQQRLSLVRWRRETLVLCLELEHVEESEVALSRTSGSSHMVHQLLGGEEEEFEVQEGGCCAWCWAGTCVQQRL